MKWSFLGFHNWPPAHGYLTLAQGFDYKRAALALNLPRETCESCVCWREASTCCLVQVLDCEMSTGPYDEWWANCCPILFFDFIGIPLPRLAVDRDQD